MSKLGSVPQASLIKSASDKVVAETEAFLVEPEAF
jgi:hypothetical protein